MSTAPATIEELKREVRVLRWAAEIVGRRGRAMIDIPTYKLLRWSELLEQFAEVVNKTESIYEIRKAKE